MSSDAKKPYAEAREIANDVVGMLAHACHHIEIAGSIRRGRQMVGDIEIVAMPQGNDLNRVLDSLLNRGVIVKALYGDLHRWGEKYKGFMFGGMKIEVFSADKDNLGYIRWLRTGPADANTWVMTRLAIARSPYRADGGYWWRDGRKLAIADEYEMFRLLGMGYLEPNQRFIDVYERHMARFVPVADVKFADVVDDKPKQKGMF